MPKKKRNSKKNYNTTKTERLVYCFAVMDPKYPRTQNMIVKMTGLAKSTVHDCIDRLLEKEMIKKLNECERRDIFYRKGKNYSLLEKYLETDVNLYRMKKDLVDNDTAPPQKTNVRTHLNGGCVSVKVVKEGKLHSFEYRPDPFDKKKETKILFGDKCPCYPKGQTQYDNEFILEGQRYSLQYQRSNGGKMSLKIYPPNIIQSGEEAKRESKEHIDPFIETVKPVLDFLQKWGEWKFEIDNTGHYAVTNKNRIEYGFDEEITDAIMDLVGEQLGVPGMTEYWLDHSKDSDSNNGEFETNNIDRANVILKLPETLQNYEKRITAIEKKMREQK